MLQHEKQFNENIRNNFETVAIYHIHIVLYSRMYDRLHVVRVSLYIICVQLSGTSSYNMYIYYRQFKILMGAMRICVYLHAGKLCDSYSSPCFIQSYLLSRIATQYILYFIILYRIISILSTIPRSNICFCGENPSPFRFSLQQFCKLIHEQNCSQKHQSLLSRYIST